MEERNLEHLSLEERGELLSLLEEKERRKTLGGHMAKFFPNTGPLRAELYERHMAFFTTGKQYVERLFMAANRVGKTVAGAYEMACHLTGIYPDWWCGRRFDFPIEAWCAGKTGQTTRDIVQHSLIGTPQGTGMIAAELIGKAISRGGIPGALDTVFIKHVTGGWSKLGFKSYDQGRTSFEGTGKHVIWLDEECPQDVYSECLTRTMTTDGLLYVTFTPLQGLTRFIQDFMKSASADENRNKKVTRAGWDHAPHLTEEQKARILEGTPEHMKLSRSTGAPGLGAGAIYTVPVEEILTPVQVIPAWWRRGYAMDVGWNCTAAVFFAHDLDRDIVYIYDIYKRGKLEPAIHIQAIQNRYVGGTPLVGVIDPGAGGRSQADGKQLIEIYRKNGLKLVEADNAVTAGIDDVHLRLSSGRLKVFRGLSEWIEEYLLYRRDEKGKIVKEDDHLMDATRYAIRSGLKLAKPVYSKQIKGGQGKRYF